MLVHFCSAYCSWNTKLVVTTPQFCLQLDLPALVISLLMELYLLKQKCLASLSTEVSTAAPTNLTSFNEYLNVFNTSFIMLCYSYSCYVDIKYIITNKNKLPDPAKSNSRSNN